MWGDLAALLAEPVAGMPIRRAFVDSGFRPGRPDTVPLNRVYEFCRRFPRVVRPTKGSSTSMRVPLVVSKIDVDRKGKTASHGLELVRLDTDHWKSWVHERLRWPEDQAGAWHLPADVDDDYCKQIVSESRRKLPSGRVKWEEKSRHNHYLDCEAMQAAAAYMMGVHRLGRDKGAPVKAADPAVPAPPVMPDAPVRIMAGHTSLSAQPARPAPTTPGRQLLGQLASRLSRRTSLMFKIDTSAFQEAARRMGALADQMPYRPGHGVEQERRRRARGTAPDLGRTRHGPKSELPQGCADDAGNPGDEARPAGDALRSVRSRKPAAARSGWHRRTAPDPMAIPTSAISARRGAKGIPKGLQPRNLSNSFSVKGKSGDKLIYQRVGRRSKGKKSGNVLRLAYVVKASNPVRADVPLAQAFERIMRREMPKQFKIAMTRAMATARKQK